MSVKKRVLIVDDEPLLLRGIRDLLVFHGFEVDEAYDGRRGLELALTGFYDLLILDVMLPHIDGFTLCNRIREANREVAIIMLTAKNADEDIVNGFTLGADDYIGKPFAVSELIVRVQAVLRRTARDTTERTKFSVGNIQVSVDGLCGEVAASDAGEAKKILFTRREVEILRFLALNCHRAVPRGELLSKVWGYKKPGALETRTVDIHIAKLRKKIEADPKNPSLLITVRAEGYQIPQASVSNTLEAAA